MSTDLPMCATSERKLSAGRGVAGRGIAIAKGVVVGVADAGIPGVGAGFSSGLAFHILPPKVGHRHYTATFPCGKVLSPHPPIGPSRWWLLFSYPGAEVARGRAKGGTEG